MKDNKNVFDKIKKLIIRWRYIVAVFLMCFFPCFFVFYANVEEIGIKGLSYILGPLFIYVLIALAVYIVLIILFRKCEKASFFTMIIVGIIFNYVVINKVFNFIFPCDYRMQTIILIVLFAAIISLFTIKKIKVDYGMFCDIVCVALLFLILSDCLMVGVKMGNAKEIKKSTVELNQTKESDRNIYYLIFDEYSGEKGLEYYYGSDNHELYGFLENNNFNIIRNDHNYEGMFTHEIVPNILNLDYVTSISGIASKNVELTKKAKMLEFFKDNGYSIKLVNDEGFLKDDGYEIVGGKKNKKYVIDEKTSTQQTIFQQGVVALILMSKDLKYNMEKKTQIAKEKSSLFDSYYDNCGKDGGKKVLLGYFNMPHDPFLFKHDGTVTDDTNVADWKDKSYYMEQVEYVNTQIERIVEKIIKDDPDSIIVMQSDHGARYARANMASYKKSDYDEVKETEYMQNVINFVYMGGEKLDISDDTSCINTWRTILNKEFGTDLEMLECKDKYIYKWKASVN